MPNTIPEEHEEERKGLKKINCPLKRRGTASEAGAQAEAKATP
ncbi:MAG: hypothetical protein ACK500_10085 [Flavobacteriales bacterium]